jgi:hypothetical protein
MDKVASGKMHITVLRYERIVLDQQLVISIFELTVYAGWDTVCPGWLAGTVMAPAAAANRSVVNGENKCIMPACFKLNSLDGFQMLVTYSRWGCQGCDVVGGGAVVPVLLVGVVGSGAVFAVPPRTATAAHQGRPGFLPPVEAAGEPRCSKAAASTSDRSPTDPGPTELAGV